MSDQSRYPSSPPSSASARPISSLARPDWPWARNYSHRSRQGSPNPSFQAGGAQSGWDSSGRVPGFPSTTQGNFSGSHLARTAFAARAQGAGSTFIAPSTESTRQWSFTGFEWDIYDIRKLKDYVETVESADQPGNLSDVGDFEILTKSPIIGDSKFKLEIVLPARLGTSIEPGTLATLSLYITTLMLDYAEEDFELHTSMMVAIKCQGARIGERGARPDWVWEFWQNDWVFRRENEVWECPLPPLSKLLEHPRIQETDSLVVCVQIHSPGPSIPQHPSVYHVPRDLLDGLEASLDNPNTGDVRFVCLEKASRNQSEVSEIAGMPLSMPDPFSSQPTARKRIVYAHSDILTRRSDYFATMLSSSFSENAVVASGGERKLYTVVVEEADFETIYWLLKYCYANWLLFKQNDDPRAAVEGVGAGWSARWLHGQHDEWEWKPFHGGSSEDDIPDNKSATSGESLPAVSRSASKKSEIYLQEPTPIIAPSKPGSAKSSSSRINSAKSSAVPGNISLHENKGNGSTRGGTCRSPVDGSSSAFGMSRSQIISVPSSKSFPAMAGYPNSPHTQKNLKLPASPDPHPHPSPPPSPASALSIYQVAHRYIMPSLAALALEHIMSTITPESSFAILLATTTWDDLHTLVEDYVVDKWDAVCVSKEFEDCCNEVAGGEWGVDGGKTLLSVFRRLRSPVT